MGIWKSQSVTYWLDSRMESFLASHSAPILMIFLLIGPLTKVTWLKWQLITCPVKHDRIKGVMLSVLQRGTSITWSDHSSVSQYQCGVINTLWFLSNTIELVWSPSDLPSCASCESTAHRGGDGGGCLTNNTSKTHRAGCWHLSIARQFCRVRFTPGCATFWCAVWSFFL